MSMPNVGAVTGSLPMRRSVLKGISALTVGGLLRASSLPASQVRPAAQEEVDQGLGPNPTKDATLKFDRQGRAKPFQGNTVVAHLPAQSAFLEATTELHRDLSNAAFAPKLALLPPESYHMTLYSGANDQSRDDSNWPGGVRRDASMAECNRIVLARMQAARLVADFPLRLRIDNEGTLTYGRACTLRMTGADQASNRNLHGIRKQLADTFQTTLREPDQYGLHISIAYTMEEFSPQEMQHYRQLLATHVRQLNSICPVLELGLAEFCTFQDMYRFDVRCLLRV